MILTVAGYAMFLGTSVHQPFVRYAATFLITAGAFAFGGKQASKPHRIANNH